MSERQIVIGQRYRARSPMSRVWRVLGFLPDGRVLCVCDQTKEEYRFASKNLANPSIYDLLAVDL